MSLDPRTPVLIGWGQVNQRVDDLAAAREPVALMADAAREAVPAAVLAAVDAIRVVNLLSWRYRDPGLALAERIGAADPATRYTGIGGNVPQTLVNQACLDIAAGRADIVLLAGGETWRTRTRFRTSGERPDWPTQDESVPVPPGAEDEVPMSSPAQDRVGLYKPSDVYPLFEQAVRIAAGEDPDSHRRRLGELWAGFSQVAQRNPFAWNRDAVTADEIWQPSRDNRMISWPYTKLLNSNNMVDQAAVVVLASAAAADRHGIPRDRWVFPHAGTDAHDTYAIGQRWDLHRSPAIRIAGERVLALAGTAVDRIDHVDVYSCFPSAVQVAAAELGLSLDRPLTVTGGLTFAGGPWNNYVMHAIGSMAGVLVDNPGTTGLVTANGGYLTKHSIGVYGTEPPAAGFRWEDVQSAVDREPVRAQAAEYAGDGVVETWTVPFGRDGEPEHVFVTVRTPGDARALARIDDPAQAQTAIREDIAGNKIRVATDGTASLR
ncbi:acetyl-CoA acetyltransferase [Mycobacterium sp. MYCO198283]|uniref:acetyl-CoA acetyltransferase n=1 Tax=Mycobacterium sp. MYCO198283 TaxID=2883505 RepID=UPI001E2947A1|nr:acetyl-CoA acetyltransferase [Mycobacterium sp. MYCO198283]MCG5433217.1 acetyl-CoA acetyltransferase [Mycobacterium sp. MYCO198283]